MRDSRGVFWLALLVSWTTTQTARAEDVRYYEQGGITYRESRDTVRQPVREIEYKSVPQTYYAERYTTTFQDYQQLQYLPVTRYQWEPRWHGWYRIFQGPELAYHLVPRTTWQTTTQTYRYPVTTREFIPTTRTVQVPESKLSFREKEVVTRTAVAPGATSTMAAKRARIATSAPTYVPPTNIYAPPAVAYVPPATPYTAGTFVDYGTHDYGQFGGVARLEGDPPRHSTAVSGAPFLR